jgi:putative addiction module antidote
MLYLQMEAAMVALKVEQVGDSVAVLLPQDTLAALHVTPGDTLYLTEAPDGYRVTPYDPELERRMAIARDIMAEDRNFLRELARH